jgi:hypothetical protein
MTPKELANLKKAYFDLLDLIIKYRIKEVLGKTGLTFIPETEIDAIPDLRLERCINALLTDKILGSFKNGKKELISDITKQEEIKVLVVNCLKTAEEMESYKNSLIVERGWPSLQVITTSNKFGDNFYEIRRRNGSGQSVGLSSDEGKFLTFLLTENNLKKSRMEIVTGTDFNESQVSNFKNVIKKKLVSIGFSEEETERMLPPYQK